MRYKFWILSFAPNIKLIIFIDQYHTNLDKLSQLGWVIGSESFYDESYLFDECGYCNAIISKYMDIVMEFFVLNLITDNKTDRQCSKLNLPVKPPSSSETQVP